EMSAGAYKRSQPYGGTLQGIRVWQLRLQEASDALQRSDLGRARAVVEDLRTRLRPEAFPEFAANLDWLYRSIAAHLEKGLTDEARAIVGSLQRLLELAAERLIAERGAGSIPPPA
ncbi:MAG: hypothetical protein ACOC3I_08900, partial [Verrucomicrobiota bacterium]